MCGAAKRADGHLPPAARDIKAVEPSRYRVGILRLRLNDANDYWKTFRVLTKWMSLYNATPTLFFVRYLLRIVFLLFPLYGSI